MGELDIKFGISFDAEVSDKNLKTVLGILQKNNNIDLNIDTNSMNNIKTQIDLLQKQFNQAFTGAVPSITMIDNVMSNISKTVGGLEKRQVKIVNGQEVQNIESIRKSLIETQRVINDFKSRKITTIDTTNYAKEQKTLYEQLNKLQKDEFALKSNLIGQDGIIKTELEKQLNLVKSQQTEIAKLISTYNLKSEDGINKNLKDRAILTSDLTIKQEKYNQSLNNTSYKQASSNLDKINKLQNEMLKAGTQSKSVIQSEITALENKNKELYKELNLQQLIKLKEKENNNTNRQTARTEDAQQNRYYNESKSLLQQIYSIKEKIFKTDQNDANTLQVLNEKLNQLNNKNSNNVYQITLENLIKLKQQEIELETQLNTLKSQKGFSDNNSELQRIAKLGELKKVVPQDLFGKTNEEIKEFIQNLYGAESKITNFKRSLDDTKSATAQMTVTTRNSKNEIQQESLILDRNTNSLYKNSESIKKVNTSTDSLSDKFKKAFQAVGAFATVTTFFYKIVHEIENGISSVNKLNEALMTVNMTMDMSKSQMTKLTTESQSMAKQMGLSVDEVLNAVKVYANANENVESILEKTKADIMLATASGMDTTSTTDAIQATMNQFQMEAEGSAERIADTLEKVSANMPMDFQRGIQSVVEGIKISGSVARDAGFDLERYESVLGSIISRTRLSGSQVSNGLKTIFSRLGKAETGDASVEEISKADSAYKQIGINLRDSITGQFRGIPEVLDELSVKWENMSSVQKHFISEVSAGNRQGNIFRNMMDSWTESTELYTKALDSNGFAQERQEIYLESTKAKMTQFKTTIDIAWQNMLSSDVINSFIDSGTKIVEVFGNFPGIIGLVTASLLVFKGQAVWGAITSLQGLIATEGVATAATKGLTKAVAMLNLAWEANPIGVIIAGVAIAGTAIIGAMSLAKKNTEELEKANDDLMVSYSQNTQQNNDMISYLQKEGKEYDELSKKTNLTTEEQTKLKGIKEKISKQFPELVDGYDSETGEIKLQAKSTEELIKLLKEKNELENAKIVDNADNVFEEKYNKYRDYSNKISELKDKLEGKDVVIDTVGTTQRNEGIEEKIAKAKKEQAKAIGDYGAKSTEAISATDKLKQLEIERGDVLNKINIAQAEQKTLVNEMQPTMSALYKNSGLNEFEQKLANLSINPMKFMESGKLNKTAIIQEINNLKQQIESDSNYNTIKMLIAVDKPKSEEIKKYLDAIGNLAKTTNISSLDLSKLMPLKMDKAEISKAVDAYIKEIETQLKKADPKNIDVLKNKLDNLKDFKAQLNIKVNGKEDVEQAKVSLEELDKAYKNATDAIKEYTGYLKEMKDNGKLSAESIADIIDKHSELAPYLNNEKVLYKKIEEAVNSEKNNAINATMAKMRNSEVFFNNMWRSNQAMFDNIKTAYELDLDNFKTVASLKQEINTILTRNIAENWLQSTGSMVAAAKQMRETLTEQYMNFTEGLTDDFDNEGAKDLQKLEGYIKIVDAMEKTIEGAKNSLKSTNFKSADLSSGKKEKKGKKEKQAKEPTKHYYDGKPLDLYEAKLKDINKQLENYGLMMDRLTKLTSKLQEAQTKDVYSRILDTQAQKVDTLHKKQELLKGQQADLIKTRNSKIIDQLQKMSTDLNKKHVDDIARMTETDWANQYNKMYGQKKPIFTGVDEKGEALQKTYEENAQKFKSLMDNLNNYNKELQKKEQEILDSEVDITNAVKERVEWQEKLRELTTKELQDKTGDIQDKIDLLEIDEKTKYNWQERIKLHKELLESQKAEQNFIKDGIEKYKVQLSHLRENTVEWSLIKNLIEEYNEKLDESNKIIATQVEKLKEVEKMQLENLASTEDKIVAALKKKYEEEIKLAKEKKAKELLLQKKLTEEQLKLIKEGKKTALEIFEDEHNKKIELLNKELKSYEEIYNAKIKKIDRTEDKDSYEKDLNKKQQEKAKLQSQYDSLLMDSSLEAQGKKEALLEQIAKKEEEINEFIHKRDITLRKQNLQDELEEKKKAIQKKIDEENKAYKKAKDLYDQEVKALEKSNEEKLKAEKLYAEARRLLMEGNLDELKILLQKHGEDCEKIFGSMGDSIKENIIKNLKIAIDSMKELANSKLFPDWEHRQTDDKGNQVMKDKPSVAKDKQWTVKMNKEIDEKTLKDKVYVIDEKGNKVDVDVSLDGNGKNIVVKPTGEGFEKGHYQLVVEKGLKSKDGKELKTPSVRQEFDVNETGGKNHYNQANRDKLDDFYKDPKYLKLQQEYLDSLDNPKLQKPDSYWKERSEKIRQKYKKYETGGLNDNTGWHWLDGTPSKPELVLNAKETDAMLGLKKYLPPLLDSIKMPTISLPKLNIPNLSNISSNQPIELKIDSLINIEGNADKSILPEIKQAGQNSLEQLKQALNKQGIRRVLA